MSAARTARTELRVLILFIVLALAQAGVRPHSAPCRVCSFSCRFPGFGAVFVTVVFCITICIRITVTVTAIVIELIVITTIVIELIVIGLIVI